MTTMKYHLLFLGLLLFLGGSCRKTVPQHPTEEVQGTLLIHMQIDDRVDYLSKADPSAPQLSTFTLDILQDESLLKRLSPIGNSDQEISLDPGTYTIRAYSADFSTPAFDTPVYSDETQVDIQSGSTTPANLVCTQSNAGVRILYAESFQQAHTSYSAQIVQNDIGLSYMDEDATRTGYFLPGQATLILTVDGTKYRQELTLQAQHIYTLTIQDEPLPTGNLSVNMTVDNRYLEEDIQVYFPIEPTTPEPPTDDTREVLYRENFGTHATSGTNVIEYAGYWEDPSVKYSGSLMVKLPDNVSSGYPGASGGCSIFYPMARDFTAAGINTSGATSLQLSFGISNETGVPPSTTDITVTMTPDDAEIPSPVQLPLSITSYGSWSQITASSGIPASESLTLNIHANVTQLLIDDLCITGIR